MSTKTCAHCHTEIPTGLAVIRSQSFQRVEYHRECWAELHMETVEVEAETMAVAS
jgi:hypothetical protein